MSFTCSLASSANIRLVRSFSNIQWSTQLFGGEMALHSQTFPSPIDRAWKTFLPLPPCVLSGVYYFMNIGGKPEQVKRRLKNPLHTGKPGPRTPEYSQEQLKIATSLLDPKEAGFLMLHINYKDVEDNNREVGGIIQVFWRASEGAKKLSKNMTAASAISAIKNSLTSHSCCEAESVGDLSWENIVAIAKRKK